MKRIGKNWQIILIVLLGLAITWPLFKSGYFTHHDELQIIRIFEMRRCFADLQIPCRWVPDMAFGFGYPLYNYYSQLPYYIGAFLSYYFGYINSAKILFGIPLVLGGISVYFLARQLYGKLPAFVTSVLYIFVPYRALDIYVRGAIAESFAISIVPLVFLFSYLLAKKDSSYYLLGLVLSFFAFLISHNIMTMLFMPFVVLWVLLLYKSMGKKSLIRVLVGLLIGFGMSCYYLLPAYFERYLIQTESLTRFELDFRAHFLAIRQLFDISWGYGASTPDIHDQISFQLGYPHVILAVLAYVILALFILKKYLHLRISFSFLKNTDVKFYIFPLFFAFALFVSVFMTHNKSAFIWEHIGILKFAQFPWRFLSISALATSFLGGFTLTLVRKKYQLGAAIVITIITVVMNFSYFKPEKFYEVTDHQMLTGDLWREQQSGAVLDYLPKTALEPVETAFKEPGVVKGDATVRDFEERTNSWSFNTDVYDNTEIYLPVFDYPNWMVKVNGKLFPHSNDNLLGLIAVSLPEGEYKVEGVFKNTPIRTFSNYVSLASFLALIALYHAKPKQIIG
jgi:hypothetical protein